MGNRAMNPEGHAHRRSEEGKMVFANGHFLSNYYKKVLDQTARIDGVSEEFFDATMGFFKVMKKVSSTRR